MTAMPETSLGIIPLLLTISAFVIPLLTLIIKKRIFYHIYAFIFGFLALIYTILNFNLVNIVYRKPIAYNFGGWIAPIGIIYIVDGLGSLLGLLVAIDMLIVIIYSWWYMRSEEGVEWYYTLLLLLEAAMIGIVYTGDIFNLFVMIELLAISAYGLVAFHRDRREAIEAAVKYSLIGATATTMFFLAIVFIYGTYGTVNMADLAVKSRSAWICAEAENVCKFFSIMSGNSYGNPILATAIAIAFALWAFTFKAAIFPNHFWLPDAHPEAPTPVSAALSGLVVKMGAYATVRIMYTVFGINSLIDVPSPSGVSLRDTLMFIIMLLGAISAIIGSLVMVIQNDVKRILAYSTIAHLGMIFMGIGAGLRGLNTTVLSLVIVAVTLHIINHSFGKTLAFLSSGIFIKATGTRNILQMRGVGRLTPITSTALIISLLHLLGVPPFGGFFSKLLLFNALMMSGQLVFALILILSTAISMLGYMRIIVNLIIPPRPSRLIGKVKENPISSFTLIVLVLIILGLGVWCLLGGIDYIEEIVGSTSTVKGILEYITSPLLR
ncbi:Membrane bound hydrogenase subunit mbhH [Staphylothermus marinus F1]|uniref:Membrane bound hydrogenase subunit mbhH n=1 Tax=Staphylothermus marinus (strain ATCC 43588 / DSM 3639 / JCM 9404 / F1) TaxID=399550 RepID=A3DNF9_STAMF|nr:proton-conducting transporter membrane subunit [Staphylothermus marinus]ABN70169.1 Membrane bound hydrogenase subunit mbhH [Staphylothermus marinus F1]